MIWSDKKKLDADPKGTYQIEFVGQSKRLDDNSSNAADTDNDQFMFVLTVLEKIEEIRLKFPERSLTVL